VYVNHSSLDCHKKEVYELSIAHGNHPTGSGMAIPVAQKSRDRRRNWSEGRQDKATINNQKDQHHRGCQDQPEPFRSAVADR